MSKITTITAREILDSRGNPTIEAMVTLDDGLAAVGAVPSGASVSGYEAIELRDNDPKHYLGKGVLRAVDNVNKLIAPQLVGMDPTKQQAIDGQMIALDGTDNKNRLGANAILAVSIATCRVAAKSLKKPLYQYIREYILREQSSYKIPSPIFNIFNGGKHAGGNIDMQEFIIIPASFKKFHEALEMSFLVTNKLKTILLENNLSTLIGDEGGFAPEVTTNEDPFSLISKAIEAATFRLGYDVFFGVDAAANSFYLDAKYTLKGHPNPLTNKELVEYYGELITKFPILYLEDGLAEDDWEGWISLCAKISKDILVVGDDLTATNPLRLQTALAKKAINGLIVKPNQIGTVSESAAVVAIAKAAGVKVIVSHRSGETNDDFVADFAVAVHADFVKFGAAIRGERVAKYNRLLQIESELTAQEIKK